MDAQVATQASPTSFDMKDSGGEDGVGQIASELLESPLVAFNHQSPC